MKVERDAQGKTRVAKGDKSGLGGQYAPDPALLKKFAEQAARLRNVSGSDSSNMTLEEYEEATAAREALKEIYDVYSKEQQNISNSFKQVELISDGTFTYFPQYNYDDVNYPHSDDGQPKGWHLRVGDKYVSSDSGLGYFATREEAVAAVSDMAKVRAANSYVKEQKKIYDAERENKDAFSLHGAPYGPFDLKLVFIEPTPKAGTANKNGYHAGWCVVAVSKGFNEGKPIFVEHQGFETREEALEAKEQIIASTKPWEGKYRGVNVEGQGMVLYNNMSSEQYEKVINNYGFQPKPWLPADHLVDYYPKSNYPGD